MGQENETTAAIRKITERGFQSWCARKAGVSRATMTAIFSGRRLCTPKQAALLEGLFVQKGIPLNRWDLLYGQEPGPGAKRLSEYLASKGGAQ